jgi:hypothetical protein
MKEQKDLISLSRSPLVNQLHSIRESITKKAPEHNMHGYMPSNKLAWIWKNLWNLGNTHYPYQVYKDLNTNNGIFKMADDQATEISVALLGDWASDTLESHNVAALCGERDYSIHLGDSYYVGNEKEIDCNFNTTFGAPWPYGKTGSFALLGNHEMYSSGKTYFTQLLPYMHLYQGNAQQQEASFFCLENKYWRIIGLDTGYHSLKGFLGVRSNKNLQLHKEQIKWIREVVQPGEDDRAIIFLSHHQPFSGFEDDYLNPAKQLSELVGSNRTVIWFWGHEHRMALYGENVLENGLKVFGRCIGNGGMPVDIEAPPKPSDHNLVVYDKRERKKIDNHPVGYNGYSILKFNGPDLTIEYYDDNDNNDLKQERKVLEEKWSVAGGGLAGILITDFTVGHVKKLATVQDLDTAVNKRVEKNPVIVA